MACSLPSIHSIATALPRHALPQSQLRELAYATLPAEQAESAASVFDNARIDQRHLACPVEWYLAPHGHAERAEVYRDVGLELMEEAADGALRQAGIEAGDVAAIVFVSTTGTATPSLDACLCNRLPFRDDVLRVPLWGLGCAGGVAGLNRADDLARALDAPVLLIAMELCSINLDLETVMAPSGGKKGVVASAVFGDGCAAAVVGPGDGPQVLGGRSHLFPDTEWVMGWDVTDRNLEVVLSPRIPQIVAEHMPSLVQALLSDHGHDAPDAWILHPGGAKVIDAYQSALSLDDDAMQWTHDVLRRYGNMSSPTVLFALRDHLAAVDAPDRVLLLGALGPGFASETALVRT